MWIFLNDGFFSIVEDKINPAHLVVRARKSGDLERVFNTPPKNIIKLPHRDYMYRTYMARHDVSEILAKRILDINYPNFKDSISHDEADRKHAYSGVWGEMYDWQDELHPQHSKKWWNYSESDRVKSAEESSETLYDVYNGGEYKYTQDTPIMDEEDHKNQALWPNSYDSYDKD